MGDMTHQLMMPMVPLQLRKAMVLLLMMIMVLRPLVIMIMKDQPLIPMVPHQQLMIPMVPHHQLMMLMEPQLMMIMVLRPLVMIMLMMIMKAQLLLIPMVLRLLNTLQKADVDVADLETTDVQLPVPTETDQLPDQDLLLADQLRLQELADSSDQLPTE